MSFGPEEKETGKKGIPEVEVEVETAAGTPSGPLIPIPADKMDKILADGQSFLGRLRVNGAIDSLIAGAQRVAGTRTTEASLDALFEDAGDAVADAALSARQAAGRPEEEQK